MKKQIGLFVAVGVVAVLTAAAAPLFALDEQGPPAGPGVMGRGPGPGGPGGRGPGFGGPGRGPGGGLFGIPPVDLTDDQKQQVKSIVDSHREEMQQVGEKMRTAREGMQALLDADTLDENAVRAKAAEVANAEADAAILQAKVRAQIFQILTPEQQQKAKEMRERRPMGPRGRGRRL